MPNSVAPSAPGLPRTAAIVTVAAVLGASAAVGRRNAPDRSHPGLRRWYRRLDKPSFTPPPPVFGAVWPALETALAVGGYRLLRAPASPARTAAVGLWLANTAMVGGWTELFFRRHRLGASTAAAGAMTAAGVGLVAVAGQVDRPAAGLAAPFAAWLVFATVLAEAVRERNPPEPSR